MVLSAGCPSRSPPCPASACLVPPGSSPLLHPVGRLLAGPTDDLIRQADASHHQAVGHLPGRGGKLYLIPVHINNRSTPATHRVIMVLRRAIDPQPVPRAAHPTTEARADEHIERVIDGGQGQGRMVPTQRV